MLKRIALDETREATTATERGRLRRQELLEEGNRLYEAYVRPLEAEHWGEFVAVSKDGRTLLGTDLDDLTAEAVTVLGRGHFAFKVGEVAVGKIR